MGKERFIFGKIDMVYTMVNILEPELEPKFIEKMKQRQREPTVKIRNFEKHFGIKDV